MDTVTLEIGKIAPTFSLPNLEGQMNHLEDYKGKITVLNFWSAECQWAQRADIVLENLLKDWDEKVALLSIASNANEPLELLKEVAEERGIPLVLHDADQQVARIYQAEFTPHIFVIDAEGLLRYQGAFDDVTFRQPEPTRNYLQEALEALLAGNDPQPDQVAPYGCTVVYYRPD